MKTWKDKADFRACVRSYAEKMNINIKSLYLRPMKTKWASCSTDGNLNFNSELLNINKELGEYVIVHELLHFKIPNHGKLWKSLMSAHLRRWEQLDTELKRIKSADLLIKGNNTR